MAENSTAGRPMPSADPSWEVGLAWRGIPPVPSAHVTRTRLLGLLDGAAGRPLVLVSAPAGSGKTTLVADWLSTRVAGKTAWVTFDTREQAFWPSLVGCLEDVGVGVSSSWVGAGETPLDPGVRRRIASTLAAQGSMVTVVVDGYEVTSADVAADLDYLLRHSGHRLQLVLVTRADPVLPLYKYRLDDGMVEVRMAQLAFDDDEVAELMTAMGLTLCPEAERLLNARTRGWVTGLRFAGKLLADSDDPERALDDVTGHTGNIAEYLMGEVLAVQPPELREVLMATSVPDVIRPGLAERLVGRPAARELALLTRTNAFIEQVPGHPGYYRYHPFFRELLRAELSYSAPETMETLQRRAAEWFADEGMLSSAVRHFASAGDWQEAARLVVDSLAVGQLLLEDRSTPLIQTLRRMPVGLDDPDALLVRAAVAFADGDRDRFDDLVAALDVARPVADDSVTVALAVLLALRARFSGNPLEAERLATAAQEALSAEPQTRRRTEVHPELSALVLGSKGLAQTRLGRLDAARATFEDALHAALDASSKPLEVECLGYLALLACWAGEITHAHALATRAERQAELAGIPAVDRSAAAPVALAWVAMERYDLRLAADQVRLAERYDFIVGDPVPRCMLTLVKSRLQAANRDRAGALARLQATVDGLPEQQRWLVDRLRIEAGGLRVQSGEPEMALLEVADVNSPGAEAELALVRVQAHLQLDDATSSQPALATVLDGQVPSPVRVAGWLTECARQLRSGSTAQAETALRKAIQRAANARLQRPFHEASTAVRQLMLQDSDVVAEHAWLFDRTGPALLRVPGRRDAEQAPSVPTKAAVRAPVEALTGKELEVLGHLAAMLTTEEIAAVMYVSVNTVRTHVRNILRKLGVNRRNNAVRLARELEILPGAPADQLSS